MVDKKLELVSNLSFPGMTITTLVFLLNSPYGQLRHNRLHIQVRLRVKIYRDSFTDQFVSRSFRVKGCINSSFRRAIFIVWKEK